MKTYLSVLLQKNSVINTIFRIESTFIGVLKNTKPEFNSNHNSFYVFKLSNDLIRQFVKQRPIFSFRTFQSLVYCNKNKLRNKDQIDDCSAIFFSLSNLH